jgi:DNA-binding MarR family transcriptional regulator
MADGLPANVGDPGVFIAISPILILCGTAACSYYLIAFAQQHGFDLDMTPSSTKSRKRSEVAHAGPTLDLERYVPAFITFIANKLSNSATARYERDFGVNVTEWRIMSLLAIEPGIPAARICQVIGFDKGPVSRTLAAMGQRGLVVVRADPDDGRTHSISLTAKGRATHDKVIVVAFERERRLLSCLGKDEQEVLIDMLRRIHNNLGAVTADGA